MALHARLIRWLLFVTAALGIDAHFPKWLKFKPPFHFDTLNEELIQMGKAEFAVNVYNKVLEGNALALKESEIEQAGQVFIEAAAMKFAPMPADKQARMSGVCGLRNLADNTDNKYAMWQDRKVREALLNSATLLPIFPADKEAIKCALQAFAALALEPANRWSMWLCPLVRRVIVKRAQEPATCYETRAFALDAIKNMALDERVAKLMWLDALGARRAILKGASLSAEPPTTNVTKHALDALANLARVYCLRPKIWSNPQAYNDLLKAVKFNYPTEWTHGLTPDKNKIRAAGLTVLAWLVLNPIAYDIYNDPISCWITWAALPPSEIPSTNPPSSSLQGKVVYFCNSRGALVSKDSTHTRVPATTTPTAMTSVTTTWNCSLYSEKALEVIDGFALKCAKCNGGHNFCREMWDNTNPIKEILLDWSGSGGCSLCRQWALETVKDIAKNDAMRMEMWLHEAGALCTSFANPGECDSVQFVSLNCLWEIAGAKDTKLLMYYKNVTFDAVTEATLLFSPKGKAMIRSIALGVLWRWSTCPNISDAIWTTTYLQNNVIQVAFRLTQPASIIERTFALGIMHSWSVPLLWLGPKMWLNNILKQAVFSAGLETTLWENNAQLQALGVLYNWAAQYHGMKVLMWQDQDGAREVLLRIANNGAPQQKEAQALAMCALAELANSTVNGEPMWSNARLQQTFLDGALNQCNKVAQECALAGMAFLATDSTNAIDMWNDNQTREVLLFTAGHCSPFRSQAQRLALATLQIIAETPQVQVSMWYSRLGCMMIRLADPSVFSLISPIAAEIRAMAIAILWTLALNPTVARRMFWDKFGVMRVLGIAAASLKVSQGRSKIFALATYSRIVAAGDDIRVLFWYTTAASTIVRLAAGQCDHYEDVRAAAMSVLWQLSFAPNLKRPMWQCPLTRAALISGANDNPPDPSKKVQLYALYTLRNLAEARCNMNPMWDNLGLRVAVSRTLADPDVADFVEVFGLSVIQMLAYSDINQRRMWRGLPPLSIRHGVLVAGNRDCGANAINVIASPCRRSRQEALATILLWSQSQCNRQSMAACPLVQNLLNDVCSADWSGNGAGAVARTYVLETLQFLSTDKDFSLLLWNGHDPAPKLLQDCIMPNSMMPAIPPIAQWTRCTMGDDDTETLVPKSFIELGGMLSNQQLKIVQDGGTLAALGTLDNMAAQMNFQDSPNMWENFELFSSDITAAGNLIAACEKVERGFEAFRAVGCEGVANMAEIPASQNAMWENAHVRGACVEAGLEHPQYEMDAITQAMWNNGGVFGAIREAGIRCIANLAESTLNQQGIWMDAQGARFTLQLGTVINPTTWQEGRTRSDACRGYRNLAELAFNREAMWTNGQVQNAIMTAAKDADCKNKRARMYCLGALNLMSLATRNQAQMWSGAEAVNTERRRRTRRLGAGRALAATREDDGGEAWARLAGFV